MDASYTARLHEVVDWLQKEFTGIRTGQATPALLDSIKIESYGAFLPIEQIGSIGIEDAATIRIAPWDITQVPAIERAICAAELGVSVVSDSLGLRIIFPELTSDRRAQLVKLAKSKFEAARISVKAVRDNAMKDIEALHKIGELSDDDSFAEKDKVQQSVTRINQSLDILFTQKESEISL